MKRMLFSLLAAIMIMFSGHNAEAAQTWADVEKHMSDSLDAAVELFETTGDPEATRDAINDVYYGIYEKDGLESAVRHTVSAKTANLTEYQFSTIKKVIREGGSVEDMRKEVETMKVMIADEVKAVENAGGPGGMWAAFLPAFLILIREGVEAILVLVGIIAYLKRAGQAKAVDTVYNYSIAAIIASFAAAYVFNTVLTANATGASRELIEGLSALFATVVLVATSAWMGSKSNAQSWQNYIKGMVTETLSSGRTKALGLAAFLAVFREGAEVILFYQALFNNATGTVDMIWAGFGAGCLVLAILFFALVKGSMKIPVHHFFKVTSILMFILSVTFIGGGMKSLQEAGVLGTTVVTAVPIPNIDILGLYPTVETLVAQLVLLLFAAAVIYKNKLDAKKSA